MGNDNCHLVASLSHALQLWKKALYLRERPLAYDRKTKQDESKKYK